MQEFRGKWREKKGDQRKGEKSRDEMEEGGGDEGSTGLGWSRAGVLIQGLLTC